MLAAAAAAAGCTTGTGTGAPSGHWAGWPPLDLRARARHSVCTANLGACGRLCVSTTTIVHITKRGLPRVGSAGRSSGGLCELKIMYDRLGIYLYFVLGVSTGRWSAGCFLLECRRALSRPPGQTLAVGIGGRGRCSRGARTL